MRDTLRDEAYWKEAAEEKQADIDFLNDSLKQAVAAREDRSGTNALSLMMAHFEMALLRYSTGGAPAQIAEGARALLCELLPEYVKAHPPGTDLAMPRPSTHRMNRFFALLVLSCPPPDKAGAFVDVYDAYETEAGLGAGQRDRLREAMAAHVTKTERPKAGGLDWPDAYAPLWVAVAPETPEPDRAGHIAAFLEGWYKEMASEMAAQTEAHKSTYPEYMGYWCLEAAAGAVMAGIDDSSFRDHPHYPAEWADWAREHQA